MRLRGGAWAQICAKTGVVTKKMENQSNARPVVRMDRDSFLRGAKAALPICAGYLLLGMACGILSNKAGMSAVQAGILSALLYAGSGQFMIANMTLAGASPLAIAASVAMVNLRHILYSSALVQRFAGCTQLQKALFAAEMTDESFGVNMGNFAKGDWTPNAARAVNTTSHLAWTLANVLGAIVGEQIHIDLAIISFSMTSIFLCLLMMQNKRGDFLCAMVAAAAGVAICKCVGLSQVAVLIGALMGVVAGVCAHAVRQKKEDVPA